MSCHFVVKVYPNGRITIPESIRTKLQLKAGDKIACEVIGKKLIMEKI